MCFDIKSVRGGLFFSLTTKLSASRARYRRTTKTVEKVLKDVFQCTCCSAWLNNFFKELLCYHKGLLSKQLDIYLYITGWMNTVGLIVLVIKKLDWRCPLSSLFFFFFLHLKEVEPSHTERFCEGNTEFLLKQLSQDWCNLVIFYLKNTNKRLFLSVMPVSWDAFVCSADMLKSINKWVCCLIFHTAAAAASCSLACFEHSSLHVYYSNVYKGILSTESNCIHYNQAWLLIIILKCHYWHLATDFCRLHCYSMGLMCWLMVDARRLGYVSLVWDAGGLVYHIVPL